jgi:23S rRNA (pseudouridine1915-N3)-methyltransferase
MNKVVIRAIGRLNEAWLREGVDMYVDRSKPYIKIEIIELPEGHGGSTKPDIEKTKRIEGKALLKGLPPDAVLVVLDETGKELTSINFSVRLADWQAAGKTACFVIGGSWGLDKELLKKADFVLSFGKLTLPHSLARLLLAEQLYRAACIQTGKAYHK